MRRHLVIFARAPQAGRVKRRLARTLGVVAATGFYRRVLDEQLRRLALDRRWTTWLFVTPDIALRHPAWRRVPRRRVWPQGGGDLGRRMKRPFAVLPPGPVVLVGSDLPFLEAAHVARAFRLLGRCDLAFGPATDGGFWLIGARRRPLPAGLFEGVRWSTRYALADARATVPPGWTMGLADTLSDVDDAADWQRYRATSSLSAASARRTSANGDSQSPARD